MNYIFRFMQLGLLLGLLSPIAAIADKGEQLYQSDCRSCHGTEVFTRPDHKVKNLEALRKRVRQCSYATEKKWSDEDVEAVVNYLNKNFYKF